MSPEISVVENGHWQFDGTRCERATLEADLPEDVLGFVQNPLLDAAQLITVHDYLIDGERVAVLFADFGAAGPGLDGAQRIGAAAIISSALGQAIVAFVFKPPHEGRVLLECHPRESQALQRAAVAATHWQATVWWDLSQQLKVSAGRQRVHVRVERAGLAMHFRIAD